MKHITSFDNFVNEARIEKIDKKNTFYWSVGDSRLVYQIPYVFPGQSEQVSIAAKNMEGKDRKKLLDIVEKANDAMNRAFEDFQKEIAKIGETAAKDFNKVVEES